MRHEKEVGFIENPEFAQIAPQQMFCPIHASCGLQEGGDGDAMLRLGVALRSGSGAVRRDIGQSTKWLAAAAQLPSTAQAAVAELRAIERASRAGMYLGDDGIQPEVTARMRAILVDWIVS